MKRILRFTASWCQPCKMLATSLNEVNTPVPIEVFDIEENEDLAVNYGVRGVPTLVMLDENIEIKRSVGYKTTKELEEWLND